MPKTTPPHNSRQLRSRVRTIAEADVNLRQSERGEEKSNDNVTNRWDDWVPQDRVMKFNEENKELAAQLHQEMKKTNQKPKSAISAGGKKLGGNRTNGSDFGSGRGSEERHASVAAQGGGGRGGPRRNRDYDLEQFLGSSLAAFGKSSLLYSQKVAKHFYNSNKFRTIQPFHGITPRQ
ncbi:Esa1p-associated factor [Ciborinia camelliae]|nr:Esa1p-associated factor [Ciborinia camelliae]